VRGQQQQRDSERRSEAGAATDAWIENVSFYTIFYTLFLLAIYLAERTFFIA